MWLSDCASVNSFGKSPPPGLNEHMHTIALVNISFLMASVGVNFTVIAEWACKESSGSQSVVNEAVYVRVWWYISSLCMYVNKHGY